MVTKAAPRSEAIDAATAGDPRAIKVLLREQRAHVIRYAMRLCLSPEDAQDATQEVLLALARYVSALRHAAALSTWLFLAVRTHCTRLARRSLRYVLVADGGALTLEGESPEEQLADWQLRHLLSAVLSDVDPAYRDVILRRDVLGESAAEAAGALGISVEAVKSRLHRARSEVRGRMLAALQSRSR